MGKNLPPRVIRPTRFAPTVPRSGDTSDDALFRMSNALIRGQAPLTYVENYAGSQNLSENIAATAITGTVALTSGSPTVTGTATSFLTELHLGQMILVVDDGDNRSFPLVVKSITSNTSLTVWRAPSFTGTVSGEEAFRLPIIFPIDQMRGTMLRGNAIRLDKGTYLIVGDGVFRLNGTAFSASVTATRNPTIGILNPTAGTYTWFTLGMNTPATPTVAALGGGSPGMEAGDYSYVIQPARKETGGFNLSSERADVTLTTGDQVRATVPAMDTTNGQNAWRISGTLYSDSLVADKNYLNGPWHFVLLNDTVSSAGGTIDFEYLDAQIERNAIVDFTYPDDPPPDAEFVAMLNNVPVWISCEGAGNASADSTSPGPWIFPAKPGNIEAAPTGIAFSTSPPETILGVTAADGRLYLLTSNHLQIAQGTPSDVVPVIIQPFWKTGFANPYQVTFTDDSLYGFPLSGPARSAAAFITSNSSEITPDKGFAAAVQEITDTWNPGHVFVAHDPVNDAICYFYSGNDVNDDGFWTTRVLVFGLRQNAWLGDVLLSSSTRDMLVSGVATVGNFLEFLCGGRLANNSVEIRTLRFDQVAGEAVSWYIASPFSDAGSELRAHTLKYPQVTAKTTSGSIGVFGAQPTETVDVAALEAGNASSLTGAVAIPDSAAVTYSQQFKIAVNNLNVSAIRIEGTFSGSGDLDRVDEVVAQVAGIGVRR